MLVQVCSSFKTAIPSSKTMQYFKLTHETPPPKSPFPLLTAQSCQTAKSQAPTIHRDGNEMMGQVIKLIMRSGKKIASIHQESAREREFLLLRLSRSQKVLHKFTENRKIDSRVRRRRPHLDVYALRLI
jgi:hypothetical protein